VPCSTYRADPRRDDELAAAIENPASQAAIDKYLDDLEDQARMTPDACAKKKRDEKKAS